MISFVVPVYRSAASLRELHQRLVAVFGNAAIDFELIFVEDCGGDDFLASDQANCCTRSSRARLPDEPELWAA